MAGVPRLGKLMVLGIVLCLVGLVSVIAGLALWLSKSRVEVEGRFGIVVDAGGSSTKLSIFEEKKGKNIMEVHGIVCEENGIASYAKNMSLLEKELSDCLVKSESLIPKERLSDVPLYLGATGGMRILKITNSTSYTEVMKTVNKVLQASSLDLKSASVLSGQDEGLYGWTAVNYLGNGFKDGKKQQESFEMGSTSSQIAFVPRSTFPKYSKEVRKIKVLGKEYDVYSHSYLCMGRTEFGRRYFASLVTDASYSNTVDDPCYFKDDTHVLSSEYLWKKPCSGGSYAQNVLGKSFSGPANRVFTFKGTGDADKCIAAIKKLILKKNCSYSHCGIYGVKQPVPSGLFSAYAAVWYPVQFMGLSQDVSAQDYLKSTKEFCGKHISEVRKMPNFNEKYSKGYCLSAVYSYVLLTHGLGFSTTNWNVNFISKINGKKASWRLGLQVLKEDDMSSPLERDIHDYNKALYNVLFAAGTMIFFMGILCLACYIAMKVQEKKVIGKRFVKDKDDDVEEEAMKNSTSA